MTAYDYLPSSGTISLFDIHDTWVYSHGAGTGTGYYNLNAYAGKFWQRSGATFGAFPSVNISIQAFYGTGPRGDGGGGGGK